MKIKQLSFKTKLIISVLSVSIIPLVIAIGVGLNNSIKDLKNLQFEILAEGREAKNVQLTNYFESIGDQIVSLSHSKMTIEAAENF